MATFKTRLSQISKSNGKVILANDYDSSEKNLQNKTLQNIKKLNPYLCAIKLNFHLLLPLSSKEIIKINKTAHDYGLQTIADIKLNDIGLVEINEAFASVAMAWQKEMEYPINQINVNGGAIALGHPLGATGARLMTTMIHNMKRDNIKYGLQTMCEGGGQANVTILENCS